MSIKQPYFLILLTIMLYIYSASAKAETSVYEFAAIGKIISLSQNIPTGKTTFSIVYDPRSDISVSNLNQLKKIIKNGYKAPKHTFKIEELTMHNLNQSSSLIFFMTEGLSSTLQEKIIKKAVKNKALTVTTSLDYVKNSLCVLGVKIDQGVKIIMSSRAYNLSKLRFDAAFKFMIKEI